MKSKLTLLFAILSTSLTSFGQVPKKVVVEHFTNTLCSICASRNPGFYTNYNTENSGNMIHLAIHPSSPYSACVFNKHDKTANDDRTKYYGVFGSTPRLVINGNTISNSTSFNNASLFTPYIGEMSPIGIKLSQQKFGIDSVRVKIVLKVMSTHSLGTQNLFVVLAENVIQYNAPNGEREHYDVFRRSLYGTTGMSVTLPTTVGDSLVFIKTVAAHADWDMAEIFALAILQNESDKKVTQSEDLLPSDDESIVLGIANLDVESVYSIYPNPAKNQLFVSTDYLGNTDYKLVSITGMQLLSGSFSSKLSLDVSSLPKGVYFITMENVNGISLKKFIKSGY